MNKRVEDAIFEELKSIIVPKLEAYREKNVVKYNAEAAGEHGGEYSTKERYKNRVRIIDVILPSLRKIIEMYYTDAPTKKNIL